MGAWCLLVASDASDALVAVVKTFLHKDPPSSRRRARSSKNHRTTEVPKSLELHRSEQLNPRRFFVSFLFRPFFVQNGPSL
uniref:Putative secreted protein n=1 Tax=Anopheles darlingi TaxID=43151 RepID=A0A2M4DL60_ANODA